MCAGLANTSRFISLVMFQYVIVVGNMLFRLGVVHRTGLSSRAGACGAPRRTGSFVRGMSYGDTISYVTRTTVPVIDNESIRTQLSKLSRPPHHPKWQRASA